jgi:DNA-binding transcriptional LysR family regulator
MTPGDAFGSATNGIDLRLLRYFLVMSEELHFTRAAARLYVSQPALSNQIQRLERQLGVALFDRTTRGVALTAAGKAFRPHVQRAVAALDAGIRAAATDQPPIRVDVLDGELRTPRAVLSQLRLAHPEVRIQITALGSASQRRRVLDGDLDVGFCGLGGADDEDIASEVIYREPVDVVLPRAHPVAATTRIRLSALARDVFYLPRDGLAPEWNSFVTVACRDAGFVPRRHPTAAAGVATALDLVAEGACVALTLRSTACPRETVRRPLVGGLHYSWVMLWHRLRSASPAVEWLRGAARAAFAPVENSPAELARDRPAAGRRPGRSEPGDPRR